MEPEIRQFCMQVHDPVVTSGAGTNQDNRDIELLVPIMMPVRKAQVILDHALEQLECIRLWQLGDVLTLHGGATVDARRGTVDLGPRQHKSQMAVSEIGG